MPDLASRDDLEHLLRDFYGRALADPMLRHVFVDVVHLDLEAHLPRITDFWQKVLFGTGSYSGQALEVHRRVHHLAPLTAAHFARWLELWRGTLVGSWDGPVADQAVVHAERMAGTFLRHLTAPADHRSRLPLVSRGG